MVNFYEFDSEAGRAWVAAENFELAVQMVKSGECKFFNLNSYLENKKKISYNHGAVSNFRLHGFATGPYLNICKCGQGYFGDKESQSCLQCAIDYSEKLFEEAMKSSVRE